MNYRSPLLIIKASAGTGKTYRLVREYIRSILYQNLDSIDFKKILALTFTRSATGEIRDRILELLARASEDKELCKQISTELDFPFKTTEAKKILRQMLANIDSVNIQTIDTLLNKCATLVASEIGLRLIGLFFWERIMRICFLKNHLKFF